MRKQVEAWHKSELTAVMANVVVYEAFVEGKLDAPKHLPLPAVVRFYAIQEGKGIIPRAYDKPKQIVAPK
jgi:hypothetical protein